MYNSLKSVLISIKNAQKSKKSVITITFYNNMIFQLLNLLWQEGFIHGYLTLKEENFLQIKIFLKYTCDYPAVKKIKIFKRYNHNFYLSCSQIKKLNSLFCLTIFSTVEGLLDSKNCIKKKIGGELLFILL